MFDTLCAVFTVISIYLFVGFVKHPAEAPLPPHVSVESRLQAIEIKVDRLRDSVEAIRYGRATEEKR